MEPLVSYMEINTCHISWTVLELSDSDVKQKWKNLKTQSDTLLYFVTIFGWLRGIKVGVWKSTFLNKRQALGLWFKQSFGA